MIHELHCLRSQYSNCLATFHQFGRLFSVGIGKSQLTESAR